MPDRSGASAAAQPLPARSSGAKAAARRLAVPLLLIAYLAQAASAIQTKSATWDETNYFGMGDYLIRHHRWDVPSSVLHPPLAFYLNGLPVLLADLDRRVWMYGPETRSKPGFLGAADENRGRALLASPANRGDRLLLASRAMTMLQAVLLGYFVNRFAAALWGWHAGVLALAFFAFCPNMLAHGSLITPDMTVTAFSFIAVYYLREALVKGRPSLHILAGLALGLALLAKFTALLLLPIEAAIIGFVLLRKGRVSTRWLLAGAAGALLVFLAGYFFDPTPYFEGIEIQRIHEHHRSFLMGRISDDGWWYYCLAAFALKTPIPALLGLAAALVLLGTRAFRRRIGLDDVVLWLPVAAVFAFFSIELRSIGLRYVLPAYPFVFVLAAGALVSLKRLKYLAAASMVWYVAGTAATWPHHLAYFNESVGGPANGYKYLVDSNLDWGQDLKGLKSFMDGRGIDRIYLSYFGLDSPTRYGISYDWLPSYELENPKPQPTVNVQRGRYLAISVTNLQGVYMEPPEMYRWLDRYTPVARIGHSIFVYYLE